jgi:hypothetical protein
MAIRNINGNGDASTATDVFTLDTTSIKHSSQLESYEIKYPHIV